MLCKKDFFPYYYTLFCGIFHRLLTFLFFFTCLYFQFCLFLSPNIQNQWNKFWLSISPFSRHYKLNLYPWSHPCHQRCPFCMTSSYDIILTWILSPFHDVSLPLVNASHLFSSFTYFCTFEILIAPSCAQKLLFWILAKWLSGYYHHHNQRHQHYLQYCHIHHHSHQINHLHQTRQETPPSLKLDESVSEYEMTEKLISALQII